MIMNETTRGRRVPWFGCCKYTGNASHAMYATTEVRWFVHGEIPDQAVRWFEALGEPVEKATRTDRYLLPSVENEAGVKLRDGNIEVKTRTDAFGQEQLTPGVAGKAEGFRKWSFPLADEAPVPEEGWIDVEKSRRVRTYSQRGVEARERPDTGCDVELGEVRLGDRVWWTVCLEAFGDGEAARIEALRNTAEHVFSDSAPPIGTAHSMGYAEWLAVHTP